MTFDYNDYKATTKDFGVCSQRKSSVQAGFRVLTTMTTIFFPERSEREENKARARIRVSLDFFARGIIGNFVVFVVIVVNPQNGRRNYNADK